MKLCLIAALVCLLPLAFTLPIQTDEQSSLQEQQETLESVAVEDTVNYDGTTRDKRTIGPLRQIFPNLSQLVDRKIQMITRVLFRVIGRLVLRGGLGGGGGGAGGDSSPSSSASGGGSPGRRISITLPTYPPGEDDEEDEEEEEEEAEPKSPNSEATTVGAEANELNGAESQNNEVRVQYTGAVEDDQVPAASGDNDQQAQADGDSDAEEITDPEEGRNKRFLPFNLGGGGGGSAGGGSGGGSGNFLFDIIRLVAGSGNTEAGDERANSAVGVANLEQAAEKDDGYQAGVPGPITRLFVIANRGIANLMQDLILRLAQTSERIVNFKARLITSII